ncbi:hypothetical protein [Krasilnikovia sp. M28-CT-15]|uniref:hypothetical protein n=1 Tax=Krasilnikovia sp. M28-CT-15 TaxID=3373540 RepID=UPI003876A878
MAANAAPTTPPGAAASTTGELPMITTVQADGTVVREAEPRALAAVVDWLAGKPHPRNGKEESASFKRFDVRFLAYPNIMRISVVGRP